MKFMRRCRLVFFSAFSFSPTLFILCFYRSGVIYHMGQDACRMGRGVVFSITFQAVEWKCFDALK
jgi:hypothetical protein